jgi:hypothetical protein
VSLIPSSLLVAFGYFLIASGSLQGVPRWSHAFDALTHPGIGGLGVFTLASLGVALAFHPVQFSVVQFFEGYWGKGDLAQRFRIQRIRKYQELYDELEDRRTEAADLLQLIDGITGRRARDVRTMLTSLAEEAERLIESSFPRAKEEIMPTRLGNVMRRFERQAGEQYGIDAPSVFAHIMLVAPPDHAAYVNDQRSQLDLAIRMSFTSVLACVMAVAFLWRHGPWLLIALVPYLMAYLSYRGAVVLARQYATAVNTVVDLDRFLLYERLRLKPAESTQEEREVNERLMRLLQHSTHVDISYSVPDTAGP